MGIMLYGRGLSCQESLGKGTVVIAEFSNNPGKARACILNKGGHGPSLGDFSLKLEIVEDLTNM